MQPCGQRVKDFLSDDICKCFVNKIGLENEEFHE